LSYVRAGINPATWAEAIPGDISDNQIIELQQRANIKLAEFLTVAAKHCRTAEHSLRKLDGA
jgi:hypothetical protein